jgi:hypothetical protein
MTVRSATHATFVIERTFKAPPSFDQLGDPESALRTEADVHGKNMTQGFDMSGTISSSPGALSSSFISKSDSHSAQPL